MDLRARLESAPDWLAVKKIQEKLGQGGHTVYLAGGSVRDALIGVPPKDFDLVTDASTEELKKIFPKSYTVGKSFGVLVVPVGSISLEVAQFRKEGEYLDGRRPESWEPATPEEDAKRRDFTANALFYDLKTDELLDFVGGLQDIHDKILRCVGDPRARLAEDRLRLFRAVRFLAQLGFALEPETERALRSLSPQVFSVSSERQRDELMKLLRSPHPGIGLQWMEELHWLAPWNMRLEAWTASNKIDPVFGGLLRDNTYQFWSYLGLQSELKNQPAEFFLVALLVPTFKALNFSEREIWIRQVGSSLKEKHKFSVDISRRVVEALQSLSGFYGLSATDTAFWQRVSHSEAGGILHQVLHHEEVALKGEATRSAEREAQCRFEPRELPERWVQGRDLKALGLSPSTQWSVLLDRAYEAQLNEEFPSKEAALSWVQQELKKKMDKN